MMNCEYAGHAARPIRLRVPRVPLALGAAMLLAGCAHGAARRSQQALSGLERALPGVYSSTSGASAGGAVSLTISPVTAQLIGDVVYFVRETPADNTQLVLWQGVWTLAPQADRDGHQGDSRDEPRIVQHSFLFKDPRRWTAAASNPDLLLSMLPQDLQAMPGCDLIWHQTDTGFETVDAPPACHPGARASGLWIEEQARLAGSDLFLTERPVDGSGTPDLHDAPVSMHLSRTGSP